MFMDVLHHGLVHTFAAGGLMNTVSASAWVIPSRWTIQDAFVTYAGSPSHPHLFV